MHADEVARAGCGCAEESDAVLHHLLPRRRDTESTEPGLEVHPSEPGVVPGTQERLAVRRARIGKPREQVVERSDDALVVGLVGHVVGQPVAANTSSALVRRIRACTSAGSGSSSFTKSAGSASPSACG